MLLQDGHLKERARRRSRRQLVEGGKEWLSKWLLCNANSAFLQLISWPEQATFQWNDDEVRFVQTKMFSWICIVLDHKSSSSRIDMSLHSDTLSWFRAKQYLLLFLNVVCGGSKYQFCCLWIDLTGARTHDLAHSEANTLTIASTMWFKFLMMKRGREESSNRQIHV